MTLTEGATWMIAAVATGGVIARPWRLPEALWAVLGALCLIAFSLVPWRDALAAVGRGTDVYLFLAGMMLLAELARQEGVFDWLAAHAAAHAHGSGTRLFTLVFVVGTLVTVFLSNDATAVVLTPAVYAVVRAAKTAPLPYLFICAFIANAASFVLPISNPANLVLYGHHMPPLGTWLAQFALPSALSIIATFIALRLSQGRWLREPLAPLAGRPVLSPTGWLSAGGIAAAAAVLLSASALGWPLGLPSFVAGALTVAIVLLIGRRPAWPLLRHISWSVLPLVAGLFVLVEGLIHTGVIERLSEVLRTSAAASGPATAAGAGFLVALACNLMNNLPTGLIAGSAVSATALPPQVTGALLIGVDLGPNLSVTGSLATILWLAALRREGEDISAWRFLRVGLVVTLPALILALAALLVAPHP
jgi:arsenical pump membrane protein